jgi:hypothetical protein
MGSPRWAVSQSSTATSPSSETRKFPLRKSPCTSRGPDRRGGTRSPSQRRASSRMGRGPGPRSSMRRQTASCARRPRYHYRNLPAPAARTRERPQRGGHPGPRARVGLPEDPLWRPPPSRRSITAGLSPGGSGRHLERTFARAGLASANCRRDRTPALAEEALVSSRAPPSKSLRRMSASRRPSGPTASKDHVSRLAPPVRRTSDSIRTSPRLLRERDASARARARSPVSSGVPVSGGGGEIVDQAPCGQVGPGERARKAASSSTGLRV